MAGHLLGCQIVFKLAQSLWCHEIDLLLRRHHRWCMQCLRCCTSVCCLWLISTSLLRHLRQYVVRQHVDSTAAQAWQTVHPPARGSCVSRPRVHIGFHRSWTTNDLNSRVNTRIVEILKSGGADRKDVKLFTIGTFYTLLSYVFILLGKYTDTQAALFSASIGKPCCQ